MENNITPFNFNNQQIRTTTDEHSNPWFVAKDVCNALHISWKGKQTLNKIHSNWRGVRNFQTPQKNQYEESGNQENELIIINEFAVFKLAFRSNKPEADKFTDWVASKVLPSIRKTGSYSTDSTKSNPLDWTSDQILQLIKMAGNGNIYAIPVLEKIGYSFDIKDTQTQTQREKTLPTRFLLAEKGLQLFIAEQCNTKNQRATIENKIFRKSYFEWCQRNQIPSYSIYKLTKNLKIMGYDARVSSVRNRGSKRSVTLYCGIELIKFKKGFPIKKFMLT